MAKLFNNAITTTAGFKYNAASPLDDRSVVEALSDLTQLVTDGVAYDKMIVGVSDNSADNAGIYYLDADTWKKLVTSDEITSLISDGTVENAKNIVSEDGKVVLSTSKSSLNSNNYEVELDADLVLPSSYEFSGTLTNVLSFIGPSDNTSTNGITYSNTKPVEIYFNNPEDDDNPTTTTVETYTAGSIDTITVSVSHDKVLTDDSAVNGSETQKWSAGVIADDVLDLASLTTDDYGHIKTLYNYEIPVTDDFEKTSISNIQGGIVSDQDMTEIMKILSGTISSVIGNAPAIDIYTDPTSISNTSTNLAAILDKYFDLAISNSSTSGRYFVGATIPDLYHFNNLLGQAIRSITTTDSVKAVRTDADGSSITGISTLSKLYLDIDVVKAHMVNGYATGNESATSTNATFATEGFVYKGLNNKQAKLWTDGGYSEITSDNTVNSYYIDDIEPTQNSKKLVTSGAVYSYIDTVSSDIKMTTQESINEVSEDLRELNYNVTTNIAKKQDNLWVDGKTDNIDATYIDSTPTESSTKLVTSGGVKSALDTAYKTISTETDTKLNGLKAELASDIEDSFSANDAMVFKGSITYAGVITSGDTSINGKNISAITNASAGWTFKVSSKGTLLGETVAPGDMVICIKDYDTAPSDLTEYYSIINSNIDENLYLKMSSYKETIFSDGIDTYYDDSLDIIGLTDKTNISGDDYKLILGDGSNLTTYEELTGCLYNVSLNAIFINGMIYNYDMSANKKFRIILKNNSYGITLGSADLAVIAVNRDGERISFKEALGFDLDSDDDIIVSYNLFLEIDAGA